MKSKYAITVQLESQDLATLQARREAGENFSACDAFVFLFLEANDLGQFEQVSVAMQDGRRQEINPGKLPGGELPVTDLIRAWLFLANVIAEKAETEAQRSFAEKVIRMGQRWFQ